MEKEKIEEKAITIVEQAKRVTIKSNEDYTSAGELWKQLKQMREEINGVFAPIIKAAHRAHQEALAQKAKIYNPVDEAARKVKQLMSKYDEEQEHIRQEKERKLREEAMKREEEARLQAAIEAEKAGQKDVAEEILASPIEEPVVVAPKEVPKMNGGPVYRTIWDMEVTDFEALVRAVANKAVSIQALLPNEVFLRAQARSLKSTMNYPGVQAYKKRI